MSKRVVITGAAGFLGQAVVKAALQDPEVGHVTACDIAQVELKHPKLTTLTCALDAPILCHAIGTADVVLHLAATLGGAAEKDPNAARKINFDATLNLIRACDPKTRFVFASSLAVLGQTSNRRAPSMVYGSHKAMAEIALDTATRRGEIDGIALRPGGIVARAGDGTGLKSAFLSQVFWAIRDGRDLTLPVSQEGATLLSSVGNVAANFMHAAMTPNLGETRCLTLPMTTVRFDELVDALRNAFPDSRSKVTFAPDPEIMRLFSRAAPVAVQDSLDAGFVSDVSLAALIENALNHGDLE